MILDEEKRRVLVAGLAAPIPHTNPDGAALDELGFVQGIDSGWALNRAGRIAAELCREVERYKNPPLPDWADGYESEAGPLTNAVEFLAMCADLADKERECQSLRDALARIEPPLPEES